MLKTRPDVVPLLRAEIPVVYPEVSPHGENPVPGVPGTNISTRSINLGSGSGRRPIALDYVVAEHR